MIKSCSSSSLSSEIFEIRLTLERLKQNFEMPYRLLDDEISIQIKLTESVLSKINELSEILKFAPPNLDQSSQKSSKNVQNSENISKKIAMRSMGTRKLMPIDNSDNMSCISKG
jgi:hypothetical protein